MGYVYSALWFLMAVLLFIRFRKVSRIIYVMCAYFLYAGVWWLCNELIDINLMSGIYGNIFRGVSIGMLILLGLVYFLEKKAKSAKDLGSSEDTKEDLETDTINDN